MIKMAEARYNKIKQLVNDPVHCGDCQMALREVKRLLNRGDRISFTMVTDITGSGCHIEDVQDLSRVHK